MTNNLEDKASEMPENFSERNNRNNEMIPNNNNVDIARGGESRSADFSYSTNSGFSRGYSVDERGSDYFI